MKEPTSRWVDVTPQLAASWMANSAQNRRVRPSVVNSYAHDMAAGDWLLTGEAIKIAANGNLLDGQHRLRAVVKSGQTIRMLVVEGCAPSVISALDSGTMRSYGDVLGIAGYSHHKTLAAIVRRMFLWDHDAYFDMNMQFLAPEGLRPPTRQELNAYLEDHSELTEIAKLAEHWRIPRVAPSLSGTCAALFSRLNYDMMLEFCDAWSNGTGLSAGSPVLVLRERLLRDAPLSYTETRSSAYSPDIKIALACMAWNAFREGRELAKLQLPRGGLTKANYPFPR